MSGEGTYDANFYNALHDEDWPHQVRAILGVCALLGVPPSYCDVGCGSGATIDTMRQLVAPEGKVVGYERREFFNWLKNVPNAKRPRGEFEAIDLELEYVAIPEEPFHLVTSWEVGEHLKTDSSTMFATTLANLTRPGGRLVFTAAQPGQPGNGHINCQPKDFWVDQISMQGFGYERDLTAWMTTIWDHTINPLLHLRDNVLVFTKGG